MKDVLPKLLACVGAGLLYIFARYLWVGLNPYHRLGYGLIMSLVPAIATLLLILLSKRSWSWLWTAGVYALLFVLILETQSYLRG